LVFVEYSVEGRELLELMASTHVFGYFNEVGGEFLIVATWAIE